MPITARHAFYESMMAHGFTMLRLHKVNSAGVCQCWDGKACRNPGKHIETRHGWQSVIPTLPDLERHMDEGGSVGLSLWYSDRRIPQSPGRLVVFDCDDPHGEAWLRSKGITSPLTVLGRRGVHIICRLADGVPELKSDTRTLQTPRIDIKVSGLVVAPWSPEKRLHIHGKDVSDDPEAVAAALGDFQQVLALIPEVDPRSLVPNMTERYPKVVTVTQASSQASESLSAPDDEVVPPQLIAEPPKRITFSDERPTTFYPGYAGLQYNRRKVRARSNMARLEPSVPGKKPHAKLLTAISNCIIHYGMSDQDTWEIIRDYFNPRCRDKQGKRYPWRKDQVAWAIAAAHQEGAYSSLDRIRGEVNITSALAHERARGERANARKKLKNDIARDQDYGYIRLFIGTYYEGDGACCLPFKELLDAVNKSRELDELQPVTTHRLGKLLAADGIPSIKGMVGLKVKVCDDPYTCSNTLRYMVCPSTPCSLHY